MSEQIFLRLSSTKETANFGDSLRRTIYTVPLDVLWSGPVGAGKSTAIRAFFAAFGVEEHVTSPTFALEQHYQATNGTPLLHLDLYRMTPAETLPLLAQTDDHDGIRCIEWAERTQRPAPLPAIAIVMAENGDGRSAQVTFDDIPLPTDAQVQAWRDAVQLPDIVRRHCDKVADVACRCADVLLERGIAVRKEATRLGARLHDLLRFVDFKQPQWDEQPADVTACWAQWKQRFVGKSHEQACAEFLAEEGFRALAEIIRTHGATLPSPLEATIEQELVYYADKRVAFDTLVSLEERFADFERRYGTVARERAALWMERAKTIERSLFPEGPPML